jgi:prevent-host-death family protein
MRSAADFSVRRKSYSDFYGTFGTARVIIEKHRQTSFNILTGDLFIDYIWSYPINGGILMKLSKQIKPISYLKAHAAGIVRKLGEQREPLVITQNGGAKVVVQDIESYEQTQETMALLKILALGMRQIEEGKVLPAEDVIRRLREGQEPR